MVNQLPHVDASLPELLAFRARHVPHGRLRVDVTVGAFLLGVALWWRTDGWLVVASVGTCFLAFGAWGLLDRMTGRIDPARRRLVRVLAGGRVLAAALGVVAAATLFVTLFGYVLGDSWQS
jgi:hypothetical protein